jgi:hypothetical protein
MATPKEGATKTQGGKKYVYKNGQWRSAQYRNPANDLVDGAGRLAGRGGRAAVSATSRSASATSTAASRTAERERQAQQNGIGLTGRRERERTNNPREGDTKTTEGNKFVFRGGKWVKASNAKPAAKPQPQPNWRTRTRTGDVGQLRQGQNDAIRNHPGNKPQPAASPKPQPAASPKPAAVTSGGPAPASRPASTASKIGSSSGGGTSKIHTYKEHGSALHVGRHKTLAEHRAAVEKAKGGGSSTPASTSGVGPVADGKQYAADKEREDKKGRTSGVGPVASGAEYGRNLKPKNYNTPDEKSKYVAPNGKPYAGPGYGNDQVASKKPAETKVETKPQRRVSAADQRYMSEAERRRKGISNVIG